MSVQQFKAKSPFSGCWAAGPMQGMTPHEGDAYPYREDDLHLHEMIRLAKAHGMKLRLRPAPQRTLEDIFEADIEATPAPEYTSVMCPGCNGEGHERVRPYYDCRRCDGMGVVNA